MFQATYFEINGFRHWTEYPSKEEGHIQEVQTQIMLQLLRHLKEYNGLLLGGRGDSYLALTNGMTMEDHEHILSMTGVYGLNLSAGVGYGSKFFAAQQQAAKALHERRGVRENTQCLAGKTTHPSNKFVSIAQFDICDISSRVDSDSPVAVNHLLMRAHRRLCDVLEPEGTTAFFVSGDNYLVPSTFTDERMIELVFEADSEEYQFIAGKGLGTPREAANKSGEMLKRIREHGYYEKLRAERE